MVPPLYDRLIARWRHGRWCHRYGKDSCINSTRGYTGSLLVIGNSRQCIHSSTLVVTQFSKYLNCFFHISHYSRWITGTIHCSSQRYIARVCARYVFPKRLHVMVAHIFCHSVCFRLLFVTLTFRVVLLFRVVASTTCYTFPVHTIWWDILLPLS